MGGSAKNTKWFASNINKTKRNVSCVCQNSLRNTYTVLDLISYFCSGFIKYNFIPLGGERTPRGIMAKAVLDILSRISAKRVLVLAEMWKCEVPCSSPLSLRLKSTFPLLVRFPFHSISGALTSLCWKRKK